jgi:glycosyltransferase involved in cell wall biosynthesis
MASGLPVIGSRIGGIPEVLGDAGILVNPDEVGELAEALNYLATDATARARYASAARLRAMHRSWTRTWTQLAELLNSPTFA